MAKKEDEGKIITVDLNLGKFFRYCHYYFYSTFPPTLEHCAETYIRASSGHIYYLLDRYQFFQTTLKYIDYFKREETSIFYNLYFYTLAQYSI